MYPVSQEFHSKITADERRIYGKVEIEYTPTLIETYEGDDLFYIRLLEEREDVEAGTIPVGNISANEIDIRLDNSDHKFDPENINSPLYGLLKSGLKVRAWLGMELDNGEKEWVPLGVFYTISWDAPEDSLYCHVTARDKLDRLSETDYATSRAIVAAHYLPAPKFVRENVAYMDTGRQVAANIPRFVVDNKALGKPVTANGTPAQGSLSMVTDGYTLSWPYLGINGDGTPKYVQVDLQQPTLIRGVRVWHYYSDGRTYYGNKTEISEDGIIWETVFDSEVDGRYAETADGHLILFSSPKRVRYIRDWLNGNSVNANNHWLEIQALSYEIGEGLFLERGTTNFVANPSFEGSFSSGLAYAWSTYSTGSAAGTRTEGTEGFIGGKSQRLTRTGGVSSDRWGFGQTSIPVTIDSDVLSISCYVKVKSFSSGAAVRLYADLYTSSGTFLGAAYRILNLTSNHVEKWTRIQAARAGASEVVSASIYVWIEGGNADILVDCVQMEDGPPTTFTNGIRADEGLRLPGAGVLDNKQGTVEFDLLVNDSYRNTEEMCLFSFANWFYQGNPYWGMNSIRLFRYDGKFILRSNSYWSAGNMTQGTCPDNLSDGWHRFAIRWQETELALFVDGEKVISISNPNLPIYVHEYSSVGCLYFLTAEATPQEKYYMQCNTLIGAARYSMLPRSDELLAAQNPLETDSQTSFFMGFDGDLSVAPEGVSLYTLIEDVLQDAGLQEGDNFIDPDLKNVLVPAAYFETQKHREALRKIAEAGLAVAYCRRQDGALMVEMLKNSLVDEQMETVFLHPAFPAEIETVQVYGIGADDYFPGKRHPDAEIKNSISVTTQPFLPGERKEVYKSEEITLKAGEEYSTTVFYNHSPCFGAVPEYVDIPQVDIVFATHYAWGMNLKIKNNLSVTKTFTFSITAYPLEVRSQQVVTRKNEESIAQNGLKSYDFPDNPLVQSREVAQMIVDNLLQVYAPARRDVELTWRGNPALELGDVVCVPEYQRDGIDARGHYVVVQQEFEWDGGLRAKLTGRRIG